MNFLPDGDADPRPFEWLEGTFEASEGRFAYVRLDPGPGRPDESSDVVERRLGRLLSWQQRLLAAVRVPDLLCLFNEFGLTDRDLVRAANATRASSANPLSTRTLRRWKRQGPPASKADERWEQLDDLRAIVGFMLADGTYDEEGIVTWLRSRQPDLNLKRPLDVLGEGRFGDVLRSAERMLAPTPVAGPLVVSPVVLEGDDPEGRDQVKENRSSST